MWQSLVGGHGQRTHARRRALEVGHGRGQHVEHVVHLPGDQVGGGRAATPVGDVHGEGAGGVFDELARQVIRAARSCRAVAQFAGVAFGKGQQFLEGFVGRFFSTHHHHQRALFNQDHGDQIGGRVEGHFGHHGLIDRQRRKVAQANGVAVGRGFGDGVGANVAACTGLVVHHHGLAQVGAELLCDLSGAGVRTAAWGIGHDERDGLAGPVGSGVLRLAGGRRQSASSKKHQGAATGVKSCDGHRESR